MQISKLRVAAATTLIMMAIYLLLSSCGSNPTEAEPKPEEELKDYPVYFRDGFNHHWCFVYYPGANTVDSLRLPVEISRGFQVSPDGDLLYALTPDRIYIVRLDSLSVIGELQYPRRSVVPSPDGQLLALTGEGLDIIRTSDHSLVFSDTDRVFGRGIFSQDSRVFYSCVSTGYVYRVDLQDTTNILRKSFLDDFIPRVPTDVEPTHDNQLWLLLQRSAQWDYWFEVYDPAADSVIFREYVTPGWGEIDISPDGRYAFFTNPGSLLEGPVAPPTITCYDILRNRIHKVISTENLAAMPIGSIAITPDGRWLVGNNNLGNNLLLTMDMRRMAFVKYDSLSGPQLLLSLVVQTNP